MTKQETAEYLGIGKATLYRYTKAGRIAARRLEGKAGRHLDYELADVERLAAELDVTYTSPVMKGVVMKEPLALPAPAAPPKPQQQLPFDATPSIELERKLILTLKEVQTLTGLGRETLLDAIKSGALHAKRVGGQWRIWPPDLKAFVYALRGKADAERPLLALPESNAPRGLSKAAQLTASELIPFVQQRGSWHGNATDLLLQLNDVAPEEKRASALWPKSYVALGMRLSQVTKKLHGIGINVSRTKGSQGRLIHLQSD